MADDGFNPLSLISAPITGLFSSIGAGKQADAARDAAKLQTDAAKYGADQQTKASQAAEAFQRQQAENSWQNAERTQQANYGQQKARYGAINQLGSPFGLPAFSMPDYVGGIDPHYDNGVSPAPGTVAGASGQAPAGIDWTQPSDQLAANLSAYFKSKGVADTEVPYWVSKAPELVARGKEINDPEYANKRLAAANIFGGAGTVNGAAKATPYGMTAPPMAAPTVNTPLATPYQPGTIAAYGRMR